MELLDRYLHAVKKHLPWKRQDDIIAELRANLEAQLEEREAELGRPLNPAEAEQWVRSLGAPIQMAAKYQPQQYLIGPAFFPFYLFVMKLALGWCAVIYVIVNAIQIALKPSLDAAAQAIAHLPFALISAAAWITMIFAVLEYLAMRRPEMLPAAVSQKIGWDPSSLPPAVELRTEDGQKPRTLVQAVAEAVFLSIVVLWLLALPNHPFLLMGPGVVVLDKSPFALPSVWWSFYWWVVALTIVQIGWKITSLARDRWQYKSQVEQLVVKALGIVPVAVMATAPVLVILKDPLKDAAQYGAQLDQINLWTHRGFLIVLIITVLQLAGDLLRFGMDAYRRHQAAIH